MTGAFKGWGSSWGSSWGLIATDPNVRAGAAGISLSAMAQLTAQIWTAGGSAYMFGTAATLTALAFTDGQSTIVVSASGEIVATAFITGAATATFTTDGHLTSSGSIVTGMVGAADITFSALSVLTDLVEFKPLSFYYGGGRVGRARPATNPAQGESEADIERHVREKWEAIEAANEKLQAEQKRPTPEQATPTDAKPEAGLDDPQQLQIFNPYQIPQPAIETAAAQGANRLASGRQPKKADPLDDDEEALMLLLSEL